MLARGARGRTYFEGLPQRNLNDTRADAVRVNAAYRKDLGRGGKHTLAGVYQESFSKTSQAVIREAINSPNAPSLAMPEQNNNRVFRRTYADITGPSTGIVMADPRRGNPAASRIRCSTRRTRPRGFRSTRTPSSTATRARR